MREEIRVLWLTPDKPADISVGRQRIAKHLEDNGFDVTLRGTTIRTVLQSLLERGSYEVIVGTTRAGAFAGVATKLLHGRPLIIDHVDPIRQFEETHSKWLARVVRYLENTSFRLADFVFYVYDEERTRVTRWARNTEQTSLGLDYDRFANPSESIVEEANAKLEDVSMKDNVVVYVGGLEPIYNIEALIDGVARLEDWTLLVLGDGSLSDYVHTTAQKREDVVYLGAMPHKMVPGFLSIADVGISLVDDPHTLKTLEYAAAGLPVVQAAGRAEDQFGDTIRYCNLNPESIATAIERAGNSEVNAELRNRVRRFDWASIADRYATALTSVSE